MIDIMMMIMIKSLFKLTPTKAKQQRQKNLQIYSRNYLQSLLNYVFYIYCYFTVVAVSDEWLTERDETCTSCLFYITPILNT